jgi:hypothetical protein
MLRIESTSRIGREILNSRLGGHARGIAIGSMARLVIHSGAHRGVELELQHGSNFLGRAEGNDFVLDDPTVSSRHCEIIVTATSVEARDLDSTNGTFIDNRRVRTSDIRDGQILMLGSMEMQLIDAPVEIAIPPLSVPSEPVATSLTDGAPACFHHPGIRALHKCRQCGNTYCEACVRELHLVGGRSRLFCPACSGLCNPIGPRPPARKKSFASRFLETIRIPFRRNNPKD